MRELEEAIYLAAKGDKTRAINKLIAMIKTDPFDADVWLLLGDLVDELAKKQDCYTRAANISSESDGVEILRQVGKTAYTITIKPEIGLYPQTNVLNGIERESRRLNSESKLYVNDEKFLPIQKNDHLSPVKQQHKTSFIKIVLAIIAIVLFFTSVVFGNKLNNPTPASPTLTPLEAEAITAVKNGDTDIANSVTMSIGVVFSIIINEGHTYSPNGWSVIAGTDHYTVYFSFYLDNQEERAEWWYYPASKKVTPANDWARTIMGY